MKKSLLDAGRREVLIQGCVLPFSIGLGGLTSCASDLAVSEKTGEQKVDALVNPALTHPVATAGLTSYPRLSQALAAAPRDASAWRIGLMAGRHHEKLIIDKPNIHLIGVGRDKTFVSFDAYSGQTKPNSAERWTTFGCASVIVRAPGFQARHLTLENTYDYLANDALASDDPRRTNDPQAVALMLAEGSDRAVIEDVTLSGHQDTLFVDSGRSLFRRCTVKGGVDFIFGAGQAWFEACAIVSRPRTKPNVHPLGYVTAPSTSIHKHYGLVFHQCRLEKEFASMPAQSVALGRPWHPSKSFPDGRYADPEAIGSSVFLDCWMDDHILSDGWWSMTGQQKSGPDRTVFKPESARFFERGTSGPGAKRSEKRRLLSDAEARAMTRERFFGDWSAR